MIAIRQKKNVVDKKVIVDIPDCFGDEVEIIILSNADENKAGEYNFIQKDWDKLTVKDFFAGYSDKDSIYDNVEK